MLRATPQLFDVEKFHSYLRCWMRRLQSNLISHDARWMVRATFSPHCLTSWRWVWHISAKQLWLLLSDSSQWNSYCAVFTIALHEKIPIFSRYIRIHIRWFLSIAASWDQEVCPLWRGTCYFIVTKWGITVSRATIIAEVCTLLHCTSFAQLLQNASSKLTELESNQENHRSFFAILLNRLFDFGLFFRIFSIKWYSLWQSILSSISCILVFDTFSIFWLDGSSNYFFGHSALKYSVTARWEVLRAHM